MQVWIKVDLKEDLDLRKSRERHSKCKQESYDNPQWLIILQHFDLNLQLQKLISQLYWSKPPAT